METVYSQKFKEIVSDSPVQAARHNSRYVMPEHLLLSLLKDSESEPSRLMERTSHGSTAAQLRDALDTALLNAAAEDDFVGRVAVSDVDVSDLAGRIIKLSVLEARMLKSNVVDDVHLLLAIFHNSDAQNSEFMEPFRRSGITYESLYRLLNNRPGNSAPSMGGGYADEDEDEDEDDGTPGPIPPSSSSSQSGRGDSDSKRSERPQGQRRGNDTPLLDKYGNDMTLAAEDGRLDPVVGREV